MGKAIVIRGANFSLHKLGTVTLTDIIPCTSLTLASSTLSIDGIGTTYHLQATKKPADTTDPVTWSSSDTDVFTVAGSGNITVTGVGQATLTAICGERMAQCVVTTTHTMDTDNGLDFLLKYRVASSSSRDYVGNSGTNYAATVGDYTNEIENGYRLFSRYDGDFNPPLYPIAIPKGTTNIRVTGSSVFDATEWWYVLTSSQLKPTSTAISGEAANCCRAFPYPQAINSTSGTGGRYIDIDVSDVDANVDSFAVSPYSSSNVTNWTNPKVTIVFS